MRYFRGVMVLVFFQYSGLLDLLVITQPSSSWSLSRVAHAVDGRKRRNASLLFVCSSGLSKIHNKYQEAKEFMNKHRLHIEELENVCPALF